MHSIIQDIRFELRQLLRKPGFTAVAILTLALGAGANALMFCVIDSVLLRSLPYRDARNLVEIRATTPQGGGSISYPNFRDVRAQSHSFTDMAAYYERSLSLKLPAWRTGAFLDCHRDAESI